MILLWIGVPITLLLIKIISGFRPVARNLLEYAIWIICVIFYIVGLLPDLLFPILCIWLLIMMRNDRSDDNL